jgi:hypothetical protein
MAIGDLVRDALPSYDVNQLTFAAKLPDGRIHFADDRLFEPGTPGFVTGLGAWVPRRRRRMSLLELIDAYHDIEIQGSYGEREAVAVPYSHIILRCGPDGRFSGGFAPEIEGEVTERIREVFGRFVDPLVDVRVRCEEHEALGADDLAALFGRGVFVPRTGESPVGHVRICRRDLGPPGRDLCLSDGHTSAGIYRGQRAIAFGNGARACGQVRAAMPEGAFLAIVPGPPAARAPGSGRRGTDGPLRLVPDAAPAERRTPDMLARGLRRFGLLPRVSARPARNVTIPRPVETTDADGAWSFPVGQASFEIEVVIDARPSRLLAALPPAGTGYAIAGVGVDLAAGIRAEASDGRWWIDIDADGHLVGSAMAVKAYSIVVENGGVEIYDWRRKDWARGAKLPRFELGEGGVVRRVDGAALGYLAAPGRPVKPSFVEEWWTGGADLWPLDWLDFAGAIEREDEEPMGLAAWHAARDHEEIPATPPAREIRVGPLVLAWHTPG